MNFYRRIIVILVVILAVAAYAKYSTLKTRRPAPASASAGEPAVAFADQLAYRGVREHGFTPVAMGAATPAQIDSALLWHAVYASEPAPDGKEESWLSLNPANPAHAPLILHLPSGKVGTLDDPEMPDLPAFSKVRIVELGAFQSGLALVKVEVEAGMAEAESKKKGNSSAEKELQRYWYGYVDTDGRWTISPKLDDGTPFTGEVAVVRFEGELKLMNRKGRWLHWTPTSSNRHWKQPLSASVRLERMGPWTHILQLDTWREMGETGGYASHLADGVHYRYLPGVNAMASPDGALMLIQTGVGPQLWAPDKGPIALPPGVTPQRPLSATTFLGLSAVSQSTALFDLQGRALADPLTITRTLAPDRFIACTGSYSDDVHEDDGGRAAHDHSATRCGIVTAQGKWWAPPEFQYIDPWRAHVVRLQGGLRACLADLRAAAAPDCATTNSDLPVPVLQALPPGQSGRQYGYLDRSSKLFTGYRFTRARLFRKNLAEVVDGVPGLIDREGKWLTPAPGGSLADQALVRSWMMVPQGHGFSGEGVIDRQGNWVIPPVYRRLRRYADGSLCATMASETYTWSCLHLDVTGKPLPPTREQPLNESVAEPAAAPLEEPAPGTAQLEAVAVDGRWGFQNAEGEWVIPPQFDDAQDFSEGLGRAAIQDPAAPKRENELGDTLPTLKWGVIDAAGKWIVQPAFTEIRTFHEGVAITSTDSGLGLLFADGQWLKLEGISEVSDFSGGVAQARRSDDTMCQLAKNGECTGSVAAVNIRRTGDRYAIAQQGSGDGGRFGYLGPDGQWAIAPRFLHAQPFQGDHAIASAALPELSASQRRQLFTTKIQFLDGPGIAAVHVTTPERYGKARAQAPRETPVVPAGLVNADGHWLVPVNRPWDAWLQRLHDLVKP
ncbi:MAG: hypothetical protein K0R03_2581 [Moraxellaceae bacterium]|jgi:hypothetical protein|nr:hypothetical protein [Moraxellaceae bacterium]